MRPPRQSAGPSGPESNHTTPTRAILVLAGAVVVAVAISFGALFGLRALFALWH